MKKVIVKNILAVLILALACVYPVCATGGGDTIIVDFHMTAGARVLDIIVSVEMTNVLKSDDFSLSYDEKLGVVGAKYVNSETIIAQAPCVITVKGIKESRIDDDRILDLHIRPLLVSAEKFYELSKNKNKEGGYYNENGEFISEFIWDYTAGHDKTITLSDTVTLNEGYYLICYDSFGATNFGYLEVKSGTSASRQSVLALPIASSVLVNNIQVDFDAYKINDNNYFKLRDVAFALNGTEKEFEVGWDSGADAIALTSNEPYTPAGGELSKGDSGNREAAPTSSKIYLDGKEIKLTAYKINGNNYFKLRDLGRHINFGVDWDEARNIISVSTDKSYSD